jgi:hypothetical protein
MHCISISAQRGGAAEEQQDRGDQLMCVAIITQNHDLTWQLSVELIELAEHLAYGYAVQEAKEAELQSIWEQTNPNVGALMLVTLIRDVEYALTIA